MSVRLLFLLVYFSYSIPLSAQFYFVGDNPYSVQWRQVETSTAKVVYPVGLDSVANRYALMLDYLSTRICQGWKAKPRKINVLINHLTIESNGFVATAPERMEIYLQVPPDNDALPWLENLAIHEYRHVLQMDQMETGLSSALKLIFGEQIMGLLASQIPTWLYEGDAVMAETVFSNAGRGRDPSFLKGLKAATLTRDKPYSLQQSVLGSFKYSVPNHYELGYLLVAYGRMAYDTALWSRMFRFVGNTPVLIIPNYFFMITHTNKNKRAFLNDAMDWYEKRWKEEQQKIQPTPYTLKNKKHNEQVSYSYPVRIDSSTILSLQFSMSEIPRFVLTSEKKKDKLLHKPGFFIPEKPSLAGKLLVWAEYFPHERWQKQGFNDVVMFDMERKKTRRLTYQQRFFSPALSPDGSNIVCVEQTSAYTFNLVILDGKNGVRLTTTPSPHNYSLHQPVYSPDGSKIYLFFVSSEGKGIYEYDLKQNTFAIIKPADKFQLRDLESYDHYLVFSASYSGIDNIYALDLQSTIVYQLTSSRFGAYYPSIYENKKLVYNDYTYDGHGIAEIELDSLRWIPLRMNTDAFDIAEAMAGMEPLKADFSEIRDTVLPSRQYSKAAHLFHIHSWSPYYYKYLNSASNVPFSPGISLLSQNLLGNTSSQLGVAYLNKQFHTTATMVYTGFYPVFAFSAYVGNERALTTPSARGSEQLNLHSEISLPLNLTKNRYETIFNGSVAHVISTPLDNNSKPAQYLNPRLTFSQTLKKAHRHIYPRWGYSMNLGFASTLDRNSHQYYYRFYQYLPGLLKNHGLRFIESGKVNTTPMLMMGIKTVSRGYEDYYVEQATSLKADYYFPLFYPDLSLGTVLYLKRIRGALFYDYMTAQHPYELYPDGYLRKVKATSWSSSGFEIYCDLHLFNMSLLEFTLGAGYYYLLDENRSVWEMIFDLPLDF